MVAIVINNSKVLELVHIEEFIVFKGSNSVLAFTDRNIMVVVVMASCSGDVFVKLRSEPSNYQPLSLT